jgi:signal transduction histidine kinase
MLAQHHPDVVVLDVLLPDLDGLEVCRLIKQSLDTRFVQVILVTGGDLKGRRLDGLRQGADDFLEKPIDPLELSVRVRSLLRVKQLYDEVAENSRELEKRVEERTRELLEAHSRLLELSQVKARLLNTVSHELRTPLHQALMALALVKHEGAGEDPAIRADALANLEVALDILAYRLGDMRALSDPGDLNLAPASAHTLIVSAVEQVRHLRRRPDDVFQLEIERGLPPVVVDSAAMTRVLTHVIYNAAQFGEGWPINVSAQRTDSGVLVTVRDEGPGMDDAQLARLFEPLQQGDDSLTRRHGGMGNGLALVKMILDAHGIAIDVDSAVNAGTTIRFTLPQTVL